MLVFIAEVGVMFVLPHVLPKFLGETGTALVDAILLTLVCAPVLWWVISAAAATEAERLTMARETEALRAQQMTTLAQLATGVAHEIRNPLTSIKMLIQVNRGKFADGGLPTDDLELVEQEIRRMERSVNSLLDYARPEQGELSVFPIQTVIRKTVQLINGRCQSSGVKLAVDCDDEPITIDGDPAQIQQLLLNLSLNALDAMPSGGELTIAAKTTGGQLELSVADSGEGIRDDMLAKLFTPFSTSKPTGIGLGLGICRRIAVSHGGTLTGANRVTGGAEFKLVLPISAERNPTEQTITTDNTTADRGAVSQAEASCKPY
ncbi:sensor histidine kinase [Rubripirellula tenax]|nr:ATP-binding protein [Rubripirellula tenax]